MAIKIISSNIIFTENSISLGQRLGISIEKDFNPQEGDLYIVFGAHDIAPVLYFKQKEMNNKFGYIIINSEQLESQFWKNKYYINLCRDNPVFHYSKYIGDDIAEKFKIIPYSFYTFEFLVYGDMDHTKIYDITFIGMKTDLRESIINDIKKYLPDKKLFFDFEYKTTTPNDLTKLLCSSDIVLNIPFYNNNALETHRINKALSCNCKVLSLHSKDEDADNFYKDYIYFTDDIIESLKNGLNETKKNYEDLMKQINSKTLMHNSHVIKIVHNKLLSKLDAK